MHLSPGRAALLAALGLAALAPTTARAQTQDLFVSNAGSNTISRFAGTGPGTFSTAATTLSDPSLDNPRGLAFDARGDLFAANLHPGGSDPYEGSITEFAAGTAPGTFGATTTMTDPSLNNPVGLAVDARGDLFAANIFGNSITEFLAGPTPGTFGPATVVTAPSLNGPFGLAFDASGDLFAADFYGRNITEFAAGATPGTFGAASTILNSPGYFPLGLAVDAHGDLFVSNLAANSGAHSITEFVVGATPGTFGAPTNFTFPNLGRPYGLAFDARGDLFVANYDNGTIIEFASTGAGAFGTGTVVETGLSNPTFLAFGPSAVPVLVSLSFPSPVPGGTVVSATVTLSGPAQADVVVGLSSSDSSVVRLHRAVVVQAGSSSATFPINTFRSHVTQAVTITASLNGVVKTVPLTITGR